MESFVRNLILNEFSRQAEVVNLVASENYVSNAVAEAVGSCLMNKYAEGYPSKRYYGGCKNVDAIERYCQSIWQIAFKTDYAVNVQPHSGSSANMAAYYALMPEGGTILSLALEDGGHLTHGSSVSFSGKHYGVVHYGLDSNHFIDLNQIEIALKRDMIDVVVAGASAYSREIPFKEIGELAHKYDAKFMVDMAHIAGLIVTGHHESPFGVADVITTTTHKTLRGPRGGMIFCKPEYEKAVNKAVFPGLQGGPAMNIIAGKAVAGEEALTEQYHKYISDVVENSKYFASKMEQLGYDILTGGTDNHLFVVDLRDKDFGGVTGKMVQEALESRHKIIVNKNTVPGECKSPSEASGIRIGTPATTTQGYKTYDYDTVIENIDNTIRELAEDMKGRNTSIN